MEKEVITWNPGGKSYRYNKEIELEYLIQGYKSFYIFTDLRHNQGKLPLDKSYPELKKLVSKERLDELKREYIQLIRDPHQKTYLCEGY